MTQNNITDIEKCARLMGYEKVEGSLTGMVYQEGRGHLCTFNPLTNKSDLMDLECALNESCLLRTTMYPFAVVVYALDTTNSFSVERTVRFSNHPDKFTALAHAVMAVVEQIYDRREG